MNLPEDFNSSDIEFEPVPSKASARRPGQASIAKIIEEASNDRLSSKRALRQLQFGRGAPSTRKVQELWVERFNAFRRFTLRQSLDEPFNGDDVLRFFDSIISKITPGCKGKPVPNADLVLSGFRVISSYGTFTYPKSSEYELTQYDGSRLRTWLDDSVKAGRLTKGVWNQRVWLNFMTVSRMARAWLDHHHELLSIVLITSLGCRVGDAARSHLYTGTEYIQYKHVELMVDGEEPKLENLRARITLEFRKGSKDVRNDNIELYLHSLNDPNFYHMCPIALLLIHALRHGLVLGSTIEQVLEYAATASMPKLSGSFQIVRECDLDKPAITGQVQQTIKRMGIISNILSRVCVHGLRLGAAQDVAHLPMAKDGAGFTTDQVRQSLGHSPSALHRGVTEKYVGNPTQTQLVSPWGPKFSDTSAFNIAKQSVTDEEIREWQQLNEPSIVDRDSRASRRRARHNIRRERSCKLHTHSGIRREEEEDEEWKGASIERSQAISTAPTTCPPHSNDQPGFDRDQIDPRLLDEDAFENVQVDDVEIEALNAEVLMTSVPVSSSFAEAWIRYCQGSTSFQDSIGQYSVKGNSRDDPTPMEHKCKKTRGCKYMSVRLNKVTQHEIYCNEALVTKRNSVKTFACSRDGCSGAFATSQDLAAHISRMHSFDPKPCPHALVDGPLDADIQAAHKRSNSARRRPTHSTFGKITTSVQQPNELHTCQRSRVRRLKRVLEPVRCPVEGCTNTTTYKAKHNLKRHITAKNGQSKEEGIPCCLRM
ncbi:hypothetical protein V1525DRAFT_417743 [Lipomyces kononenkoae]|uniref:Uncharacterized protein n=1 Tax=Lipomyces kononenkoae TaxID=34357 RepID=A0ACC3T6N3_LIPKO